MSLKIEQGLFSLDFTDYHAILGIPIDTDAKDLRKYYLTLVRRLHPDSRTGTASERQRAEEYLSKLVNPAYEKLSQEKEFVEYGVVLRLKGQQAVKQQDSMQIRSEVARNLASASNMDVYYHNAIRDLAARQYQELDRSLEITGEISELNLVYLMKKSGLGQSIGGQSFNGQAINGQAIGNSAPASGSDASVAPAQAPITLSTDSLIEACLRRAQDFERQKNYPQAILELREATRLDSSNSNAQSQLGMVYLATNQPTMAKIHFNKALELNPRDSVALEGKRKLGGTDTKVATSGKVDSKGGKPETNGGFFGLFGKKK